MAKKKPPYNQNAAIRGALRRAFARSPIVTEVMQESRREVPRYNKDGSLSKKPWVQRQCQVCNQWVGSTKIVVDHKDPVISVDVGFQDWNEFVVRLWCNRSNLQRICDPCHDVKTAKERFERMYKAELDYLDEVHHRTTSSILLLKFAKKFTPKRLDKYPYPEEFKEKIKALKIQLGIKIPKPKNKS
jgi:5-methylcytosine-specific restriction endonuclease McrA